MAWGGIRFTKNDESCQGCQGSCPLLDDVQKNNSMEDRCSYVCEQGVTLASNLDNLDRSTHESVGAPTLARDYAAASSDNGNDNGKRATERQREVVYSLIEEHTKQYLEDPKVKPDYLNLEEWLTRSIFNETGIDIPRIKQILVVFPFSDDLKQAMGISVGGGE